MNSSSGLEKSNRIGELLLQCGALSEDELNESQQVAADLSLPLGKVLIMSGFITDEQLQAIVKVQSLIKDGLVTSEQAASSLSMIIGQKVPLSQALSRAGWVEQDIMPTNKLGDLLLEAGIVSRETLASALKQSTDAGLPLGRILALTGVISESLVYACLNAQVLLRDKKIDRQQAVRGLLAAYQRQQSIEQVLMEQGIYRPLPKARIKLGELFVCAGILDETTILNCLERGLLSNEPLGNVLIKGNFISADLLAVSLKVQEMVDKAILSPIQAAQALKDVHTQGMPLDQAVANAADTPPARSSHERSESGREIVDLGSLLKLAGVLTEDDIQESLQVGMMNSQLLGKILLLADAIDEPMLQNAQRCQALLREHKLSQEQAIIALNYCQRMSCSIDEAMRELGWTEALGTSRS